MAEIKVPSCVNYTDLRPKKEDLPQIEVEQIKNYAKQLKGKALEIFLAEIDDTELIAEVHRRMIERNRKIKDIERYLGM